jgi:signal transduction histidine kinase
VTVRERDGRLVVEVSDDGRGGATLDSGTGLRGLSDRVEAVGGMLAITSSPKGTTLRAELPLQ